MSFTSRALILLLVVAVLGVSYTSSIRAWLNQRNEQQTLSAQIAQQKADIVALSRSKARWNDPAYIEDQARLRFGWVLPGERTFRVIEPDGSVMGTPRTELADQPAPTAMASVPWWNGIVHSLSVAANPPAPKPTTHQPARQPATKIVGGGSQQ
jgi:cell division protein FtsB